jgi:glycosyltransferase involved in cell wall biosynthesis
MDKAYFLSLCTLEPRKNVDRVIRCFARLLKEKQIQDVNLVLVGVKGWHFDKIFNEIESNKDIRSHIIITGFVEDKDLAALYSASLGFVYPSIYEGFGLPPLEAMQCGVPVVTSNTSSLPEVVGDAGIMVTPTDEDALCQAMLNVYQSESLRKEMSAKSLHQAARFSWEKCIQDTINGYKMAMQT